MGIPAASIRSAVELGNTLSAEVQVDVIHEAWIGGDGYGKPVYAAPVIRKALVQEGTNQHRRMPSGDVITARAAVTFLDPVPPNGTPGRREPIDPRDRITLPSGLTGPIVEAQGGMIDPSTNAPYISSFWLK
jgi:hypothetical protein